MSRALTNDKVAHTMYGLPDVYGSCSCSSSEGGQLAGRGYNLLLVSRRKEGLVLAAKELREASR